MGQGIGAKLFWSLGALLLGPVLFLLFDPLVHWSAKGGLIGMAFVSGSALVGIWRKTDEQPSQISIFISRCWRGEERLWKVFWLVGIGFYLVVNLLSYAGTALRAPIIWWIIVLALGTFVEVWWAVSVWRCAKNTNKKIWSMLSRTIAAISALGFAYSLIGIIGYFFFGIDLPMV